MQREIQVAPWMQEFLQKLQARFSDRLLIVGLQGSYGRGEAGPDSDIDLVVVLERMHFADLQACRSVLSTMPHFEKTCGFFGGRQELMHWPRCDLLQLYYDTQLVFGDWGAWFAPFSQEEIEQAVLTGAANLYHLAQHTYLHAADRPAALRMLYKQAFFLLRTVFFARSKRFVRAKRALLPYLEGQEKQLLRLGMGQWPIDSDSDPKADVYFQLLWDWLSGLMKGGRA